MPDNSNLHNYNDLILLFDGCFFDKFNTRLVKGASEPLYIPAGNQVDSYSAEDYHRIVFANGFFRSAVHEIAHWLVAGCARRLQVDYGYWYQADGRTASEQAIFEQVEVRPQAIEWILTKACRHSFAVSVDNLSGAETDPAPFKRAVHAEVIKLQAEGLGERAECIRLVLAQFYGAPLGHSRMQFAVDEL